MFVTKEAQKEKSIIGQKEKEDVEARETLIQVKIGGGVILENRVPEGGTPSGP